MAQKVLFLNDTHNVPGGAEDQLMRLIAAAGAAGIETLVGCIPGSAVESMLVDAGVAVAPLRRLRANPVLAVGDVARLCRERSIDIIHTGSFIGNFVGRLAGRRAGTNVFSSVHCEPDASLLTKSGLWRRLLFRLRAAVDRATQNYTDVFIAVSTAVGDKLAAQGIPAAKIHVVPNGIDVASTKERAGQPASVDLPEGRLVGLVARLEAVKGIEYLLEAVELLAAEVSDVRLILVGDGSLEGRLKARGRELGIDDRVVFMGYLQNPLPVVAALDVYALPSLSEGLNITLLEAMALERPVVATAVGGNPELIEDMDTGLLVPPREPEALAAAIKKLLDEPQLGRTLAKAGASLVAADYSSDRTVERILSLYREAKRAVQ